MHAAIQVVARIPFTLLLCMRPSLHTIDVYHSK